MFDLNTVGTSLYLQNVSSTNRKNKTIGVSVAGYQKATLKNCQFNSSTTGGTDSGYDIVVNGNSEARIFLENTTGNTNQPKGTVTTKGNIVISI